MPEEEQKDDITQSEELSIAVHIDYRIHPCTSKAIQVINDLTSFALRKDSEILKQKNPKARSRKKDMTERILFCIKLLLTNLIYQSFNYGHDATLRVSRSKQKILDYRYNPEEMTQKAFIAAQDILSLPQIGLITMKIGRHDTSGRHSIQTLLKPSEKLLKAAQMLVESDFDHSTPREVIILKQKQKDEVDYSNKPKGKWTSYEDTNYTNKARSQLIEINQFLRQADIKIFGRNLPQQDRQLKRYFNESFDLGGRLFGGSWQGEKAMRKNYTINGEACVEVDFQACGLRLAYAKAGKDLNKQFPKDPYIYIGYERAGTKKMLSAMLCSSSPMKRFPDGMREDLGVGKHIKVGDVTQTIEKRFADIAHLFYSGVGLELMHTESEILINALLRLQSKGVVALPIHDCVVVAESDQGVAREEMLKAFKEVSGANGTVDVKALI